MGDDHDLVTLGLDELSIGFGIFDAERRLVSCNRPFQTLRDYPDALCKPGTSLDAMLRFNAERGDFGPGDPEQLTKDWLAKYPVQTETTSFEQDLVTGRTLQVYTAPTPTGGFVNIVTDITENKKIEEETLNSDCSANREWANSQQQHDGMEDQFGQRGSNEAN